VLRWGKEKLGSTAEFRPRQALEKERVRLVEQPLLAEVVQVLRGVIPGSPELDAHTELLGSGLIDSLSLVTAVTQLETRFGFMFPPEALVPETFETPAALHAVVVNNLSSTSP
jgi:acyl carrier protein